MKKFVFRYESVLKKREDDEEDIKTKLGVSNNQLQTLLLKKKQVEEAQRSFFTSIQTKLNSGVQSSDLQMFEHSKQHYKVTLERLDSDIATVRLEIIQLKKELTEAVKQRKIMEKIKEKDFNEYMDAVNAAENKLIEEIVNYKSSQKSGDS